MQCYEIKSRLEKYLDHRLDESEQDEITFHLQNCPHCTQELRSLQKIEEIIKSNLYWEPPKEYWKTVPKIITTRLGLNVRPSVFEKLHALANDPILSKRFRWGLASAFAGIALIVIVKLIDIPNLSKSPMTNGHKTTKEPIAQELVSQSSNLPKKLASISDKGAEEKDTSNIKSDSGIEINEAISSHNEISQAWFERSSISCLNPKKPNEKTYSYNHQLIPVANTNLLFDRAIKSEDVDKNADAAFPIQRTFGMGGNISSSQRAKAQNNSHELTEAENCFTETLWIVQQSHSLSEKRNIWLSYVSRERDPTYRSLGIYNLALVLSQLVEKTKDPEMAEEALSFYKENEKSLQFQMSPRRYQTKIKILETIVNSR
ncbi:MAG: anti-sigma factor family protein [bacterium]